MSIYDEAMRLVNSHYSFEALRRGLVDMLMRGDVYISVGDIQAIWINKYEDHITIAIYLRTIEVNVRIYKDDDRIYTSIYPIFHCDCCG